jgi:cell division transport system ATP-binding protein
MIQFYGVTQSYDRENPIFSNVDLFIEKGEFVFLTGKSGAGKTTLMKMVFCQEQPDQGQIIVDGRNIARLSDYHISFLRRTIGVVFQDFKLIDTLTVFDNVAIALKVLGLSRAEIQQRVTMTLGMVGLEREAKSYPLHLSGGQQQRVAIARALVNNPKILLADEPTGNLDPSLSLEILDLFHSIHIRGTTIVMATHEHSLVQRVRARQFHIEGGRVFEVQAP